MIKKIYSFYYNGFSEMSQLGRTLWLIIVIKLLLMFAVLKVFFFPDFMKTNFDTESEKSDYIIESITKYSE